MIRKHPSLLLLSFIIIGIVIADGTQLPAWLFLLSAFAVGVIGLFSLSRSETAVATVLLTLAIGLFSAFHFGIRHYDTGPHHLRQVVTERRVYRIYGRVTDWPDLKQDRTEIKIGLDSLGDGRAREVGGAVLLKITDTSTTLQRGDRVEFVGRIYPLTGESPAGAFDYRRYLNLKDVFGVVYLPTALDVRVDRRSRYGLLHLVDELRGAITDSFRRNLDPAQAALAGGFLIGETRDIPGSIYRMFRDSGTLHLLAVSGSNVALILICVAFALRPFNISRRKRALILLGVILVFAELSYEEPSVIRASIMAALVISAGLLQRRYDLNNIIGLAAAVILLFSPAQLYDAGFQLSFVTAWGLVFIVPRVSRPFAGYHNRWWYRWLVFPFLISLTAQISSAPIIAYHFGQVPAVSPVANMIVVPLVSVGVVAIMVLLLADLIWPLLGLLVGSFVNGLLSAVLWCLHLLGGENMPVIEAGRFLQQDPGIWMLVLVYALIIASVVSIHRKAARRCVLFLVLTAFNLYLLNVLIAGRTGAERTMEIRSVPGGVAALFCDGDGDRVDLIVTGLDTRDYRIDQSILAPWLDSRGIAGLNSLFVHSVAYDAIDDILELGRKYGATAVYFDVQLAPSVADVVGTGEISRETIPKPVFYEPRKSPISLPGYYPGRDGILVLFEHTSILLTDRLTERHFRSRPARRNSLLVIGRRWRPSVSDWISLRRLGYGGIICSKIEPVVPEGLDPAERSPGPMFPHYIHDLSQQGHIRIRFGESAEISVR
jgi:competence protein ComEC